LVEPAACDFLKDDAVAVDAPLHALSEEKKAEEEKAEEAA
jgi:hypothetical protein